jgi:hypothetical protein
MRKLFPLFLLIFISAPFFSQEVDYIGIPELSFGETKLVLAASHKNLKFYMYKITYQKTAD